MQSLFEKLTVAAVFSAFKINYSFRKNSCTLILNLSHFGMNNFVLLSKKLARSSPFSKRVDFLTFLQSFSGPRAMQQLHRQIYRMSKRQDANGRGDRRPRKSKARRLAGKCEAIPLCFKPVAYDEPAPAASWQGHPASAGTVDFYLHRCCFLNHHQ